MARSRDGMGRLLGCRLRLLERVGRGLGGELGMGGGRRVWRENTDVVDGLEKGEGNM